MLWQKKSSLNFLGASLKLLFWCDVENGVSVTDINRLHVLLSKVCAEGHTNCSPSIYTVIFNSIVGYEVPKYTHQICNDSMQKMRSKSFNSKCKVIPFICW